MYRKITRAFTIVELIICVAVLAILASIALPYFHEYQSRQEAKQIPIKLSAVNRYARSQAAVFHGEQILHIDALNLKYGNLSWRGALSSPSVTYQAHTALPIGSNGSFYYCSAQLSSQQRIVLSKMGHIRVESLPSC